MSKYAIGAQVEFASNGTGLRYGYIRLNGTTIISPVQKIAVPGAGGLEDDLFITTQYFLNVNDYVEVIVFQNSGGSCG